MSRDVDDEKAERDEVPKSGKSKERIFLWEESDLLVNYSKPLTVGEKHG